MGLSAEKHVGPATLSRYLNKTGTAYIKGSWQPATVTSVRKHHGRVKLTVVLPDKSTIEVTLNLWRS